MPESDDDLNDPGQDSNLVKNLRQQLEEAHSETKALKAAQRELAFLKAGVNVNAKAGQLLLKSYDGDLSDIEALQNEAKELGVFRGETASDTTAQQQTQDPGQGGGSTSVETGSAARREVAGGEPVDPNQQKPVEQEAREAYDAAIKAQASTEDAQAAWLRVKAERKAKELGLV